MTSLPIPVGWREPRAQVVHSSGCDIGKSSSEDEQSLLRAFRTFADAATALEQSYSGLRDEVDRLRRELALSNGDLARSSEENRKMRAHLDQILDRLPCGVLVIASDGQISRANPEALRLMKNCEGVSSLSQFDPNMRELLEWSRGDCEPECKVQNSDGSIRWIGAQRAMLEPEHGAIVILQDLTERKRGKKLKQDCAGIKHWQKYRRCWLTRFVIHWEVWNCLPGCWPNRRWKESVASGWSTFKLDCEHWQRR